MALKFNPFSGTFDLTGSGGGASYIDGEVQNFSALPQTIGSPAVDSAYLVREAEGAWLLARKPAGIYIRTANTGVRASDWTYAGEFPDVFSDDKFVLYDETDSSKNLVFQLSGITTGTTRTLTVPNASGRIQVEGQPIGNTTPAAGTFTTLAANNGTLTDSQPALTIAQTWNGVAVFDASISATTMTVTSVASGTIRVGMIVTGGSTTFNTVITALGTGTGGAGTYTVSVSQSRTSATLTGSVGFSAAEINITNTASAGNSSITTSRYFDINVDGSLVFSVRRFSSVANTTFCTNFSVGSSLSAVGASFDSNGITLGSATSISWRNNTNATLGTQSVALFRDGADDTLAQRRGSNPQTYRLYNTYTDASNHERGFMRWSSNVLQIGTEKAGTGSARALEFQTDGTTRLTISTGGSVSAVGTLTGGPIQSNAGVRVAATSQLEFGASGSRISNQASGVLTLHNSALSDFGRLQFGGTTTSFPALKRDNTALQVRLADDSAFAPFVSGDLGIGVTPERPLHIQGSAAFGRMDRQGTNGPAWLMIRMATGTTVSSSWLFGPATGVASVANDDFSIIDYGTSTSGTSGTQRLTIAKSDGQLTVNGNLNLSTKNLVTDTTTGTKIGTATDQKIGFFNATPVVQQAAVADATDAASTQARLNDLLARLRTLGLIAT